MPNRSRANLVRVTSPHAPISILLGIMGTAAKAIDELADNCDILLKQTERSPYLIHINRNVNQINEKSQQLAQSPSVGDASRAQSLLRTGGLDLGKMSKDITNVVDGDTTLGEAPMPLPPSNDVEGYLSLERDKIIISAIEETRAETLLKWRTQYLTTLQSEWEHTKRELLSYMSVQTLSNPTPAPPSHLSPTTDFTRSINTQFPITNNLPRTVMDEHMVRYANIVAKMVNTQKPARPIPTPSSPSSSILEEFADLTGQLRDTKVSDLRDVWVLLRDMMHPGSPATAPMADSLRAGYEHGDTALVTSLVEGALRFLQSQYAQLLETAIGRQPELAQRGGNPSLLNTVRAYLNITGRPESKAKPETIIEGSYPAWAMIYYCMRCGGLQEALEIATKYRDRLGSFHSYFREYVANKRRLPLQLWEKMCAEFNSEIRTHTQDSYKLAVWNLVSRCDVNEFRAFRDVITSTQDFIWYKLMLSSTELVPDQMRAQDLRLKQIQQQLLSLGPNHFSSLGRTPFIYLFVLFSVQLFEEGIVFLFSSTPYQTEAIHMAIALYHYGLLRVINSKELNALPVELMTHDEHGNAVVNFPRLLRDYAARLIGTNPVEALNYCALLRDEHAAVLVITDLVLSSGGEFDMLLGHLTADNSMQLGLVGKHFPKLLKEVQMEVATRCQTNGKIEEAVKLFDLAGERDAALTLMNRQLSKFLATRTPSPDRQRSTQLARQLYARLAPLQYPLVQTRSLVVAFEQLLSLDKFFELIVEMKLSEALQFLDSLQLIPFQTPQIQTRTAAFHRLHETVKRLFPEILSITMQALTHLHSLLTHVPQTPFDTSRQEREQNIRSAAKAIVTFAGTIQYQIPKDLTAQLLSSELIIRS